MSIVDVLISQVFQLVLYVHIFFHRLLTWIRQRAIYSLSRAFATDTRAGYCGVVFIGDVVAEGIGDNVADGGLTPRINRLLRDPSADQARLMLSWTAVSVGRLFAKSCDWLPVPDEQSRRAEENQPGLFHRTLISGPSRRADVVVVIVGAHDDLADADRTVRNIVQIADAGARLGKHMLVAGVPSFHHASSDKGKAARTRNRALGEALEPLVARKYDSGSVTYGVDTEKVLARGHDIFREEEHFTTLNTFGYRALAREVLDALVPVAKRVEWKYFKERLTPSRN